MLDCAFPSIQNDEFIIIVANQIFSKLVVCLFCRATSCFAPISWMFYSKATTVHHCPFSFLPLMYLRHQQLISAQGQRRFKWTMRHTSKSGMKSMAMSVLMARTVQVFSAALRIAEQELGGMEGYIFALPKWTPMPAYSSPPPSVCLIWSTGYLTFTFKQAERKLMTWALLLGFY